MPEWNFRQTPLTGDDCDRIVKAHSSRTYVTIFGVHYQVASVGKAIPEQRAGAISYHEAVRARFRHILSFRIFESFDSPVAKSSQGMVQQSFGEDIIRYGSGTPKYLTDLFDLLYAVASGRWCYRQNGSILFENHGDFSIASGILVS